MLSLCRSPGLLNYIRVWHDNSGRGASASWFLKYILVRDLLSFASIFSVVFCAFLTLFYLLFVSTLPDCSSLLRTAQMLFEMMLMKCDAHQLSAASASIGPIVFSLFILVVVFVCMSIINESFRRVREQSDLDAQRDQPILSFMIERFRRSIGKIAMQDGHGSICMTRPFKTDFTICLLVVAVVVIFLWFTLL